MTSCIETKRVFVMFKFATSRAHLFDAILSGRCPDFECSLGGSGDTDYTALWRPEHADAVRAWAQSSGIHVTEGPNSPENSQGPEIKLPDIGDIATGGVVAPCIADVERMLADQGLEPTALNWIAVCDHFISLPLIRGERAAALRLLRQAIERIALSTVRVASPMRPQEDSE